MKYLASTVILMAFAFAASSPAQAPNSALDDVLKKMDAAAASFNNVVSNITYTKVTVIVDDKSVEKGKVFFQRLRGKKGASDYKVRINFTQPGEKIVLFTGKKGYIYRPSIKQVEEYDVSRNREAMEQFLLLGFGTPGHELLQSYNITLVGDAQVSGQDTVKLELLPKSASMQRHIKKVELWLSKSTWQPVQQTFTEPSGDYLTTQYDGAQINASMPDSTFDLKLPKGTKTIHPQS